MGCDQVGFIVSLNFRAYLCLYLPPLTEYFRIERKESPVRVQEREAVNEIMCLCTCLSESRSNSSLKTFHPSNMQAPSCLNSSIPLPHLSLYSLPVRQEEVRLTNTVTPTPTLPKHSPNSPPIPHILPTPLTPLPHHHLPLRTHNM